jgi:hypothetical protein
VEYINRTYKPVKSLKAVIEVVDRDSRSLYSKTENVDLSSTTVTESASISDVLSGNKGVSFVDLDLKNANGKLVSHNVYWIAGNNDFKSLNDLPAASVNVTVVNATGSMNEKKWTLEFRNTSDRIAFFINPQLVAEGEEIAPSLWSDNYFTLTPKGSLTITVSCPSAALSHGKQSLKVDGWNIPETLIPLTTAK